MSIVKLLFIAAFSFPILASAKPCTAPKSIGSDCDKLKSDVEFRTSTMTQVPSVYYSKTGLLDDSALHLTGNEIGLFDLDKVYTIQTTDSNSKSRGVVLSLVITTVTSTAIANQRSQREESMHFIWDDKKMSSVRGASTWLKTETEPGKYRLQNQSPLTDNAYNTLATADYTANYQVLPDGSELVTVDKGNLDIDLGNDARLKSYQATKTSRPSSAEDFKSIFGKTVYERVFEFIKTHGEALQKHRDLNKCLAESGNCSELQQLYAAADKARDEKFLSMLTEKDVKVPPAPRPPAPPAPPAQGEGRPGYFDPPSATQGCVSGFNQYSGSYGMICGGTISNPHGMGQCVSGLDTFSGSMGLICF